MGRTADSWYTLAPTPDDEEEAEEPDADISFAMF